MIEIRELKSNDNFKELVNLSKEFFKEYESHHEEFFKIDKLEDKHITDYFSRWINNNDGVTYIAISNMEIVGYITIYVKTQAEYWKVKRIGDISGLMVKKSHRCKGIASLLFEKSMIFFKKKGVKYFTVFTAVENHVALSFYKKQKMSPIYSTMMGEL